MLWFTFFVNIMCSYTLSIFMLSNKVDLGHWTMFLLKQDVLVKTDFQCMYKSLIYLDDQGHDWITLSTSSFSNLERPLARSNDKSQIGSSQIKFFFFFFPFQCFRTERSKKGNIWSYILCSCVVVVVVVVGHFEREFRIRCIKRWLDR